MSTKLDIYAASVSKTIRWQAELAALDAARSDTGRLALATLQSANGFSPARIRCALRQG